MATSIEEFSVLSPTQKKELERKRQEEEARKAAEAAKKATAARKAKEQAKKAAEAAAVARKRKESKKTRLKLWIGVLYVLIAIVIWLWIHYCHKVCFAIWQDNIVAEIFLGIIIYALALIIVGPITAGIASGIEKLKGKLKEL